MATKNKISTNSANRRINTAIRIFSHPLYILIAVLGSSAFFYIFHYLISRSNNGVFIIFTPIYLIYALVITSGILFSISVFAIIHSVASRRSGVSGGIASALLPAAGSLIASCGCSFSLLASILLFLGINTFEAAGIISFIGSYQAWIILAMISANILMIIYYLGKPFGLHQPLRKRG
ncbi:MAG: hypothetical protein M1569_04115 [Candidatus Marsarchaeota archaeon]|nr:hypothetical protein [Candidatus Marsarchaeota archaeon]MCL5413557.1 hypothetical protein [Candidatus Marsarchaeota archaeon]